MSFRAERDLLSFYRRDLRRDETDSRTKEGEKVKLERYKCSDQRIDFSVSVCFNLGMIDCLEIMKK